MVMKFRAYLLFGGFGAMASLLPHREHVALVVALAASFGFSMLREMIRQRRASRRPVGQYKEEPWVDCGATKVSADGGLISECHERRGHEGQHQSLVESRWS